MPKQLFEHFAPRVIPRTLTALVASVGGLSCSSDVVEDDVVGTADIALVAGSCPVAASISQSASGTHDGVDLSAGFDTPIYATGPGVVTESGPAQGYGQWIRIRHDDGSMTEYGHMRRRDVRAGERVSAGQRIALVGSEGRSTGPHLHLRTYRRAGDGKGVDPKAYLGERGISLPCVPGVGAAAGLGLKGTECPGGRGIVTGAIEAKYKELGGCGSTMLGVPAGDEQSARTDNGRFQAFERGAIYWSAKVGAHAVHGSIREAWQSRDGEAGELGYPTTSVLPTADGRGQVSKFENGAIYSMAKTGTHSVQGKIYEKWIAEGAERGDLGYPTSSEHETNGLRRSDFQNGLIVWDPKTGLAKILPRK